MDRIQWGCRCLSGCGRGLTSSDDFAKNSFDPFLGCGFPFELSLYWAPLFCEDAIGFSCPRLECFAEFLISAQSVNVMAVPAIDLLDEEDRTTKSVPRLICTHPLDGIASLDQAGNALHDLNQFVSFKSYQRRHCRLHDLIPIALAFGSTINGVLALLRFDCDLLAQRNRAPLVQALAGNGLLQVRYGHVTNKGFDIVS